MKIGTKSLLFGAHQFLIHPIFLAIGWMKLYGFPWHPAIWLAFIVHDWGYWGKPNMDGDEGQEHPILGSKIVKFFFGDEWGQFTLFHSRWYAKKLGGHYSKLCVADKMAMIVTPSWLYLPMIIATGEYKEYKSINREPKYKERGYDESTPYAWHQSIKQYMKEWIMLHKDVDRPDSWTPNGADVTIVPHATLPGYLEGGYEFDRYTVTKTRGETSPDARYMVFRYDGHRDPHSIFACLAYSISVRHVNPQLSQDIQYALRTELDLTIEEFEEEYGEVIHILKLAKI